MVPLAEDATVVAFGDSLTSGSGSTPGNNYPARLAAATGLEVINEGRAGEVSAAGLARLPGVLDRYQPELVVLIHGGNDMLRKLPSGKTRDNIAAMVDLARSRGADVVMLGVPGPALLLSSAELYAEIAAERQVPIDLDVLPEVLGERSLKSDTIHPNDAGYQRIADAVEALLRESGAL